MKSIIINRNLKPLLLTIIALSCFIFTSNNVYSQYSTKFEEDAFKQYEKSNGNAFDLLNAINYNESLYNKGKKLIDEHINYLKSKNIQLKPLKRQIQIIYKTTHSKFLKKYEIKAFFNNIFENGQYNCVAASALYGLIFDEFNINYSIRETPSHVYLIADTLGLQTLIETTLPSSGVVNFSEKYKKDFITYLNSNKIIADSEYKNATTDELFNKYYSKDKSINLFELAAIQYYNKGIFLLEENKFSGASSNLRKALTIYPSNNIKYNHYAALQNALISDNNKKVYDGKLFGEVVNSSIGDSSLIQLLSDYFDNVSVELCINSPDINRFNNFYSDILSECSIENIPNKILYKYHYYRAYNFGINGMYPLALSEIKKSYMLKMDNLMVKELAQNIAIKHLFVENNYKRQIDSIEYYFQKLPFLIENQLFQQQYVYFYMKVISNSFMYNEPKEGTVFYNRFLSAIEKYSFDNYSEENISAGFGAMAFYFADNMNFSKALQIVDRGLTLSPRSLRLLKMKSDFENAKKMSENIKTINNYNPDVIYTSDINPTEDLNDKINKYFHGKWKAISIIIEDMEQNLTKKESFEFAVGKNKNCTYTLNGKTEKGKWAYRPKSKCIYFVPDYDKDKYKVFKVKEVHDNKIILLPYKDQKTPSPYNYVLKPSN